MVPAWLARMASTSRSEPMAALPPVSSTNRQTASTLGTHRPSREPERAQVRGRSPVDGPGSRRPVVGFDAGDVGENEQHVGVEGLGQQAGGGVLVHDGFDALELAHPIADDRGAPPPPQITTTPGSRT